jgi:hypothetical protein
MLRLIKLLHTVVWAFFVGCIVAIPYHVWFGSLRTAVVLSAIVMLEVVVLVANRWSCPMTGMAARYTTERQDNFDIYLPLLIARYNKQLFGTLYVVGLMLVLARWRGWLS